MQNMTGLDCLIRAIIDNPIKYTLNYYSYGNTKYILYPSPYTIDRVGYVIDDFHSPNLVNNYIIMSLLESH